MPCGMLISPQSGHVTRSGPGELATHPRPITCRAAYWSAPKVVMAPAPERVSWPPTFVESHACGPLGLMEVSLSWDRPATGFPVPDQATPGLADERIPLRSDD